ncbi:hypothetical protein [Gloeothece verrucosa]|uniref:NHL repeat containing protein n=1 Tax=Gloeothece verrucosa (strain PCC 7822) TaxID=497965 RepID=E0UG01_GLOV7|nr:hypothetical protein [Gloeothece verrucosa]ADN14384.1 hypothetical protein Cyan7822_2409 [Gloeothece verrucosa PCC 7822]
MKKPLKVLSFSFLVWGLICLVIPDKAHSLSLSFVRFASHTDEGLIVGSSLEITGAGNIYAVDGFNNSLQALHPSSEFFSINNSLSPASSNNGEFRWQKYLSIDKSGNLYRSSQITSSNANNVYVVDGINNQLQALSLSNGNLHLVDGINNSISVFNPASNLSDSSENNNPPSQFSWLKTLSLDQTGKPKQSNQIHFTNANHNFYPLDGINQQFQAHVSETRVKKNDNFYLIDGINNQLNVLPNNSEIVDFLNSFKQTYNYHWDWESNFSIDQDINGFADLLENLSQANSLASLENGKFYNDFLPNNWLDLLKSKDNFNSYQVKNIYSDSPKNIYFIDGINNQIQYWQDLQVNDKDNIYLINGINSKVEIIAVPESSPVLALTLLLMGFIATALAAKTNN